MLRSLKATLELVHLSITLVVVQGKYNAAFKTQLLVRVFFGIIVLRSFTGLKRHVRYT